MKFVNTLHQTVTVLGEGDRALSVTPPSGLLLETRKQTQPVGMLKADNGQQIPLVKGKYGPVRVTRDGRPATLPDPQDGVFYLVSSHVLDAWPREDFLAPEQFVREPLTQIIRGCRELRQPLNPQRR